MRVLVTGASGFIGSALVSMLVSKGHEVMCLIRSERRKEKLQNMNVKFAVADITEREKLFETLNGLDVDVLYHLAAVNPLEKNKKVQQRVNVDGMRNIIDACKKGRVGLFVYVQGMGVFGDRKGAWIDESTVKNPDTDFAKTRNAAEEMFRQSNSQAAVAILGDVYGPGGWFADMIVKRLRDGSFKIPGSGDYYRSFVHVDDAANALKLMGERNAVNNTYIVCDDEPARFDEFVNYVADRLGMKRPGKVPAFLAKTAVGSEMIKLLTSSTRARNGKIKKELGFTLQYPTYREGVEDAIRRI
jgi:nucleoside-diphosphate-sugar epimerase